MEEDEEAATTKKNKKKNDNFNGIVKQSIHYKGAYTKTMSIKIDCRRDVFIDKHACFSEYLSSISH